MGVINKVRNAFKQRRICVLGSGPAGLFFVKHFLLLSPSTKIDLFEKESRPFGLLRTGVAPDNKELKGLIPALTPVLKKTRLFLNSEALLSTKSLEKLSKRYRAVVVATGCSTPANNVPNRDCNGAEMLRAFNGVADFPTAKLTQLERAKSVSIVGLGNVALDVARLLTTDWPKKDSAFRKVSPEVVRVLGRGKLVDNKFSVAELKKLQNRTTYGLVLEKAVHNMNSKKSCLFLSTLPVFGSEEGELKKKIVFAFGKKTNTVNDSFVVDCTGFKRPCELETDIPNVFLTGWAKRGAVGNLSDTIAEAKALATFVFRKFFD